jgi:hypothetical protein
MRGHVLESKMSIIFIKICCSVILDIYVWCEEDRGSNEGKYGKCRRVRGGLQQNEIEMSASGLNKECRFLIRQIRFPLGRNREPIEAPRAWVRSNYQGEIELASSFHAFGVLPPYWGRDNDVVEYAMT